MWEHRADMKHAEVCCVERERRSMSKMQVGCGGDYATLRRFKLAVDTHVRISLHAQGA